MAGGGGANVVPFRGAFAPTGEPRLRPSENHFFFEAVASHGSIRKAADALHIASSALNRRILDLEEEIGTPLFERLPRGVRLTAAGERLLSYVHWSLEALHKVEAEIRQLKNGEQGAVKIALLEALGADLLCEVVADYQREHAGIAFRVEVGASENLREATLRDDVDFYVTPEEVLVAGLEELASVAVELCVIMSPRHPLADRGQVALSECLSFPRAALEERLVARSLVDQGLRQAGVSLAPTFEAANMDVLKSFVRSSDQAVALAFCGAESVTTDGLRCVPLVAPSCLQRLRIVSRKGRVLPVAVASFLAALEARSELSARWRLAAP